MLMANLNKTCHQAPPLKKLLLLLLVMLLAPSSGHWVPSNLKQRGLQQLSSSTGQAPKDKGGKPILRCATIAPPPGSPSMQALMRETVQAADSMSFSANVSVVFHVVHNGIEGKVPDDQLQRQLSVVNQAFNGSGFSFQLQNVTYTDDPVLFSGVNRRNRGSLLVDKQRTLRVGGAEVLNAYILHPQDFMGMGTFPYRTMTDPAKQNLRKFAEDGVIVDYETLPGGTAFPYNLGHTLTHMIGHWLALYHTFEGGCLPGNRGDFISDTPAEREPMFGCDLERDTCNDSVRFPGKDPVQNFMDYSDDACMTTFTPMQIQRMQRTWTLHRAPKPDKP
jgi:hypothetical protein